MQYPQGMMPPAHGSPGNPFLAPAGLVEMPAHGEPVIPLGGMPQGDPLAFLPGPGGMPEAGEAARPAPLQQPDRLGRNPADVKAMIQENARRQYEQRFGQSFGNNQSMAASGQQGQLDELIARLSQARMSQMADRRTARRGT
jgi:hypothetical protein